MTKKGNTTQTKTKTRARSRTGALAKQPGASSSKQSADLQSTVPHDHVAVRAYHRYLSRDMAHGDDLSDWLQAERDLAVRSVN